MKRWINRGVVVWQYIYETRVAPWLAFVFGWLLWPVYYFFHRQKIIFLWNMADGTGHSIPELDYFFHLQYNWAIDASNRHVLIRKKNVFSRACVRFYKHKFYVAAASNVLYDILLPLALRYPALTLDIATTRQKWQVPPQGKSWNISPPWQTYLYLISKEEQEINYGDWYKQRGAAGRYFPLQDMRHNDPTALLRWLGSAKDKLALIHLKTSIMNATAKVTDPTTYEDALRYLQENGYSLVFVGREKMPGMFKEKFNMLDYAGSKLATFGNDIQLFRLATIAVTCGSGINWLADCYDIPYVYLNYWHISKIPASYRCVAVPTLTQNPDASYLSFSQQMRLYKNLPDYDEELFPSAQYMARNATGDEILEAVKELVVLKDSWQPRTTLQDDVMKIDSDPLLRYSQARVAQYFLEKHSHLLS